MTYCLKKNQTSWSPVDGHRCWRCVGWPLPSPASQPRGSSPPSCPGWWPCWECGAAVKRSVTAEGCWMFAATCCCCCGRGTCIQRSHCRCCSPWIPTPASDITLSSPCVEVERALCYSEGCRSEKAEIPPVISVIKPYIISMIFAYLRGVASSCGGMMTTRTLMVVLRRSIICSWVSVATATLQISTSRLPCRSPACQAYP